MHDQSNTLKQINKSGFPFQLRVEDEIRSTQADHRWSVASHEHPWSNPGTESSGFIDIVLKHNVISTLRLVIECKRMKADDARQLRWLFLLPGESASKETHVASCFEVEARGMRGYALERTAVEPVAIPWQDLRIWDNVRISPASLQSEFCVLPSDEQRRQPILESLAREVLESVEGLAQEEVDIQKSQESGHVRLFILPAIVTNAEIAVCRFRSSEVKIVDGTLDPSDVEISIVPFIRFRKSLATDFPPGASLHNLATANQARERTVFIVNATSLSEFLRNWDIQPLRASEEFALRRLLRAATEP